MYRTELGAAACFAVVDEGLSHREAARRYGIDAVDDSGHAPERRDILQLQGSQLVTESWRCNCNAVRPHSSLGYRPPARKRSCQPRPGSAERPAWWRNRQCTNNGTGPVAGHRSLRPVDYPTQIGAGPARRRGGQRLCALRLPWPRPGQGRTAGPCPRRHCGNLRVWGRRILIVDGCPAHPCRGRPPPPASERLRAHSQHRRADRGSTLRSCLKLSHCYRLAASSANAGDNPSGTPSGIAPQRSGPRDSRQCGDVNPRGPSSGFARRAGGCRRGGYAPTRGVARANVGVRA